MKHKILFINFVYFSQNLGLNYYGYNGCQRTIGNKIFHNPCRKILFFVVEFIESRDSTHDKNFSFFLILQKKYGTQHIKNFIFNYNQNF